MTGPDDQESPGVVLRGLEVVVGRRRSRRTAVAGVDLELTNGVSGLLGPNGAGKTTLMRALATVLPATSGDVRLLGRDVRDTRQRTEVRRRLGYLPQSFGFYPRFTVRELVTYFAWLKEMDPAGTALEVEHAIERVGLSDRAESRMSTLSGGMVRRAGLAQALVNSPELLLLDEPTAGLDPEQRMDFRSLLREIGVDTTVVVSTHLVEDVAGACSRVVVMDEGRVVFTGSPDQLEQAGSEPGEQPAADPEGGVGAIEQGYLAVLRAHRSSGGQP